MAGRVRWRVGLRIGRSGFGSVQANGSAQERVGSGTGRLRLRVGRLRGGSGTGRLRFGSVVAGRLRVRSVRLRVGEVRVGEVTGRSVRLRVGRSGGTVGQVEGGGRKVAAGRRRRLVRKEPGASIRLRERAENMFDAGGCGSSGWSRSSAGERLRGQRWWRKEEGWRQAQGIDLRREVEGRGND